MKSPAFQFYVSDYLGSQRVQMLTLEEEGAYIRLICYCWQYGSIPSNHKEIARLVGKGCSSNLARVVASMFTPHDSDTSKLVHDRLKIEKKKQEAWKGKCSAGGKKSAELKKMASRLLEQPLQDSTRIPIPSSSSLKTPIVPKGDKVKCNLQLRAEKLMRRKPETPLAANEDRAIKKNMACIVATSQDDWLALEIYYAAPQHETYARRDLAALLNNWNGEIDRAKAWMNKAPDRPAIQNGF